MSDKVMITLIVCMTLLLVIGMIRSTLRRLVKAEKENFTFVAKFFGAGVWLFRGSHKPTDDALPKGRRKKKWEKIL